MQEIAYWVRKTSSHGSHAEVRLMGHETLPHESLRLMMQSIENFVPPPAGQWGTYSEVSEGCKHEIEESVDEDVCEES